MSDTKPTVRYWGLVLGSSLVAGNRAYVLTDHHPVLGKVSSYVHTTAVQSIDENGVDFETLNTKYVFDGLSASQADYGIPLIQE